MAQVYPGLDFGAFPETANDILEAGREYAGGAPATVRIGKEEVPNTQRDATPQAYLGIEQMAWFKERLRAAKAPWKIWGHSFGTLTWRTDPQNLPPEFAATWPSEEYGIINRSWVVEHAEIFGMVRDEGITGLTIVAGDKHSFWAGYPSETLPPRPFEPVAVEFVTGSISQQGLDEVHTLTYPRDNPLRPFYVHDRPDGSKQHTFNTTILHGVRAALALRDTNDPAKARAARNPDNAPHLTFTDFGGYGYTTVRAIARRARNRVRVHSPAGHAQRTRRRRAAALSRRPSRRALGAGRAAADATRDHRGRPRAGVDLIRTGSGILSVRPVFLAPRA